MEENDEYSGSSGLDPQTQRFFKKILSSFFTGIFWMILMSTLGFYFGFAVVVEKIRWYNWAFFALFIVSLLWLLRYYYRKWKD